MKRETVGIWLVVATAAIMLALAVREIGHAQQATGGVTGRVSVQSASGGAGDNASVVVYLENAPAAAATAAADAAGRRPAVRQRDLRFTPELVALRRGGQVEFPNDDRVYHNVFSLSRTKRFDLGLYRSGESRSVRFDRAGVVDVYCNIHPDMIAQIVVVDTPYFAIAASNGAYVIPRVPAGTWNIVAVQRFGDTQRGQVRVPAGGSGTFDVRLRAGARPTNHRRADGTPYGRYR